MRTRVAILTLQVAVALATFAVTALPACAAKDESLEELISRAESARREDRPALYLEIARQKADIADQFYRDGNSEAGTATLREVVSFSKKATDASIETGKRLKNSEIALRKMVAKFGDVKRTVAFEDQAPIQQTLEELEKMRTDLLTSMFGKKKAK